MYRLKNRARKRWFWAASRCITKYLKLKLQKSIKAIKTKKPSADENDEIRAIEWRIVYNLTRGGNSKEAYEILRKLCVIPKDSCETSDEVCKYNLLAGQCCLDIFYETKEHEILTRGYQYYEIGIQSLKLDLFAMFRLPVILQDFGRLLEHHGSFEGALAIYSKIMSNFPTFRGYFHVMYRVAIVGKYVGEVCGGTRGQEFNDQCTDMLQFLLEAVPKGICHVRYLLLPKLLLIPFLLHLSITGSHNPNLHSVSGTKFQSLQQVSRRGSVPVALRCMHDINTYCNKHIQIS